MFWSPLLAYRVGIKMWCLWGFYIATYQNDNVYKSSRYSELLPIGEKNVKIYQYYLYKKSCFVLMRFPVKNENVNEIISNGIFTFIHFNFTSLTSMFIFIKLSVNVLRVFGQTLIKTCFLNSNMKQYYTIIYFMILIN